MKTMVSGLSLAFAVAWGSYQPNQNAVLVRGIKSSEHAAFVAQLAVARTMP